MAIADELTKLENNRANIVAAINNKGGELADNAGLAACPEAIEQLGNAGGATHWTGHVDEAGLRYIGWDDDDIANLKASICWDEEDDELYAVPQDHKDLWDACEKVVVNGRTMLAYSEIGKWINYELKLKYLPMINCHGVKSFSFGICKWMISIPLIDTSAATSMSGMFNGCTSLVTIPLIDTSAATNMSAMFLNCAKLKMVPKLNVKSATTLWNIFGSCQCLEYIDDMSIPKNAELTLMFNGCSSFRNNPNIFVYQGNKADGLYKGASVTEIMNDDMSQATILSQLISGCKYLKRIKLNFTKLCTNLSCMFDSSRYLKELSFEGETSFEGITNANGIMARNYATSIPKTCVTYTMCTQLFITMLRGTPAYSAASYPMYFESGSTVTDNAAGTLQSLVEQCQAMGWAIYNLTINPYSE